MIRQADLSLSLLFMFFVCALIGIGVPVHPSLANGLPWVLILVWFFLILSSKVDTVRLALTSLAVGLIGFGLEIVNMHTGLIYGKLPYHQAGLSLDQVPVSMIGLWALSVCLAGAAARILDLGPAIHVLFQSFLILVLVQAMHSAGNLWEYDALFDTHLLIGRWMVSLLLAVLFRLGVPNYDDSFARFAYSYLLIFLFALVFTIR
jgi:hypothetical protein